MRLRYSTASIALLSIALAAAARASVDVPDQAGATGRPTHYGDGMRRWTVRDSISQQYLTRHNLGELESPDAIAMRNGDNVLWSPDRRHVLVVDYRGDAECDCLRYTMTVHSVDRISAALAEGAPNRPPPPVAEARFETDSAFDYRAGIYRPRWHDPDTIVFTGIRDGRRELFRLSLPDAAVTQLTHVQDAPTQPRSSFYEDVEPFLGFANYALQGEALVYDVLRRTARAVSGYPSLSIADARLSDLSSVSAQAYDVYLSAPLQSAARHLARCLQGQRTTPSLSPDGRWAVFLCNRVTEDGVSQRQESGLRYWLLDVTTAQIRPIALAASGSAREIRWRPDGTLVALLGATGAGADAGPAILVLDPMSESPSFLGPVRDQVDGAPAQATGLAWDDRGNLVISYRAGETPRLLERPFSRRNGSWRAGRGRPAAVTVGGRQPHRSNEPTVRLRESANQPWSLMASDGRHEIALTSPDPALEGVWRAPMREFSWQEGRFTMRGGLILPRDHQPGTRLPLVIQAGAYLPDRFLTDGSASTIFAAQALAAQGMAVLNIDYWPAPDQNAGRRFEDVFGDRIDAIVSELSRQGLVDPHRVGLTGFSHSGYQSHYLATHPRRTRLAAVVVADSTTQSYGEYVDRIASRSEDFRQFESRWGGDFWNNAPAWIANAPVFNAHNIAAPILFELHGKTVSFSRAETIAAYRRSQRPFEYFLIASGVHQLRRPRERMASMGNNVAWMAFWLQDREIPGLQSEETYARWRRMRELRDAPPAARPVAAPATQQGDGTAP